MQIELDYWDYIVIDSLGSFLCEMRYRKEMQEIQDLRKNNTRTKRVKSRITIVMCHVRRGL
jgi:hypothetical protein